MNKTSKRILGVGLPLATVALTGVAFAAWTATGSGSGSAAATNASNALTVSTASATADLYPGGVTTLTYDIANSKAYSVQYTHVSLDTSAGKVITATGGCPVTKIHFADQTFAARTVLPAGATGQTVPGVSLDADAPDSCQNTVITIPVTVS